MARLPDVKKEEMPLDRQHIYDEIQASRRGTVTAPMKVLMHVPELARRIAHLGTYVIYDKAIPAGPAHLAALVASRHSDCFYIWNNHERGAREDGSVRQEAVRAIRDRTAPKGLTPEEALVVTYSLQVVRDHKVSDEVFQQMLRRYGQQGVLDVTAVIAFYTMMSCFINSLEIPSEATPLIPLEETPKRPSASRIRRAKSKA